MQHWPRILFLDEPNCEQGRKELRPGQCNREMMVGIAQIEARNTLLFELVRAESNPRYVFVRPALDWNAGVPLLWMAHYGNTLRVEPIGIVVAAIRISGE